MKFHLKQGTRHRQVAAILTALLWSGLIGSGQAPPPLDLTAVRAYIKTSWRTLERSNLTILRSASDSKVGQADRLTVYVARDENPEAIRQQLAAKLTPAEQERLEVKTLPENPESIHEAGLLYLPYPYVVPGGRFNEMYGWDSYFTLLGLVRDGEMDLAKDMTDNFVYEIQHYGKILNANRTYYLTRSQPPFLTEMVLEVYRRTGDLNWLRSTVLATLKYYDYWTKGAHFTAATGLSRYDGGAATPAPEVVRGEKDASGKTHYDRIREYYKTHPVKEYDVSRYYNASTDTLTPEFYTGDRAMRESGFDPSARFGPFSVDITRYNSVDLNCLLYRMEMDMAAILTMLEDQGASDWAERAAKRAATIKRLMWNSTAGLYFDYNFMEKRQSTYPFLTAYYPMWAGIASKEQAKRLVENLKIFEEKGGLQMSTNRSGNQWDAPFGWAPMEVIVVEGLRRYGYLDDADRISREWLGTIAADFQEHGTIKEKYDVVTAKSDLAAGLKFGYTSNEIGFGWTNASVVLMDEQLKADRK
jgi:alpha,alpha-trehalase